MTYASGKMYLVKKVNDTIYELKMVNDAKFELKNVSEQFIR